VRILGACNGEVKFVQVLSQRMRDLSCANDLHDRTKWSPKPYQLRAIDVMIGPIVQEIDG
jgi:hypothetical protein